MSAAATPLTGRCLCGAVAFTARVAGGEVGACHCSMCRRQATGPMFATLGVEGIEIAGEESLVRYRSSEIIERAFCRRCGSKLFSRVIAEDDAYVCTGALDDQARWKLRYEIFFDDKPGYYDFANATRRMAGAEFVGEFMSTDLEGNPKA